MRGVQMVQSLFGTTPPVNTIAWTCAACAFTNDGAQAAATQCGVCEQPRRRILKQTIDGETIKDPTHLKAPEAVPRADEPTVSRVCVLLCFAAFHCALLCLTVPCCASLS